MKQQDIQQVLQAQGATPQEAAILAAIAMAESGGNPGAANVSNIENSHGLFQINLNAHPSMTTQTANDPASAAAYALSLYREQGGKPWSVFTNGSYQKYLGGSAMTDERGGWEGAMGIPAGGTPAPVPPGSPGAAEPVYAPDGTLLGYNIIAEPGYTTAGGIEIPPVTQFIRASETQGADHYSADVSALITKYQLLRDAWAQEIENIDSAVTLEEGRAGFEADWAKLMNDFNTTQATLQQNAQDLQARLEDQAKERQISDVGNREISEANRRLGVAEEAGRRAKTITGDVLPRFVTGNNPVPVPYLGDTYGTRVNFGELFNQGGAGNLNALPPIAPQFAGGYGATQVAAPPQLPPMGPMPTYPGAPAYPAMPGALQNWLGI
jgi:hypothetical protein